MLDPMYHKLRRIQKIQIERPMALLAVDFPTTVQLLMHQERIN
jgi:hypothetical protein